jgi:hypothetical protein
MTRCIAAFFLFLFANLTPVFSQTGGWANPRGFFQDEVVEEREISPGVRWISASGRLDNRPVRAHIIAVDLRHTQIGLQALLGERFLNHEVGQFVKRSTLTQMTEDSGALAAINVAFFDIGSTQAFQGLVLRDGILLREPQPDRPTFIFHPNGRAAIAEFSWEGQVRVQAQRRPLQGINRPSLESNEIVAYFPPWARSPGNEADFVRGRNGRELIVDITGFEPSQRVNGRSRILGRITAIRDGQGSIEIRDNQFVVSAGPGAASFLRHAALGQEVEIAWELFGHPPGFHWHEIREAVSAQPILLRQGEPIEGSGAFWNNRHPRSAVAINRDGRQVLLVLIDGRHEESVGMSLPSRTAFLQHMEAHQALNLDGGGSSAITGRISDKVEVLNVPSDGRERFVPTGLGVVLRQLAAGPDLSRPRTWTGANGRRMHGSLQSFDPATNQVVLILDGRRFTIPLSSLSEADQELVRSASVGR